MNSTIVPSFKHFQKDIERRLKSEGKCEKNEFGQMVFHGYQAAASEMFRAYIEKEAFAPLGAEFRKWNWEWGFNDQLLELTVRLRESKSWLLLLDLWAAVVAKRRTNYNKTKKARKIVPEKVSEELVTKTRNLLLESLFRLREYAAEFGRESEIGRYLEMIAKVERRLNA
jgi:hypothetical protein